MRFRRTLLLAALVVVGPLARPARGQAGPIARTGLGQTAPLALPAFGQDTTTCPQCVIPKKIGRAAWELVLTQLIPWSFNHFVRDAEWASISPAVWWTNLQNPWQWDNNAFLNNQFSHPYHGSLYFNVGRTNGFNFWESSLWSFGGSFMWEIMGEQWAPAPNDLLNTGMGGITLGEMLFRASSLALDNTATGFERTMREIAGTLLDPVRGFNRILDGQMNDVTQNPADWRPSKNRASLDMGNRHSSGNRGTGPKNSGDQFFVELELDYGDSIDDLDKKPFSFMEVSVGLAEKFNGSRAIQDLHARGSLAAKTVGQTDKAVHRLAAFMTYDFFGQPSFEYGAQGFQGGLVSRFGKPDGLRLHTELLGVFQPVAALQSDYFLTEEGRDYDYGVSMGSTALARLTKQGFGYLEAQGTWLWTGIISGFNGDHNQYSLNLEGKVYPIGGRLGIGGGLTWYHKKSDYNTLEDVSVDGFQSRIFAALSIPRWNKD
jgi:hypothetical protein